MHFRSNTLHLSALVTLKSVTLTENLPQTAVDPLVSIFLGRPLPLKIVTIAPETQTRWVQEFKQRQKEIEIYYQKITELQKERAKNLALIRSQYIREARELQARRIWEIQNRWTARFNLWQRETRKRKLIQLQKYKNTLKTYKKNIATLRKKNGQVRNLIKQTANGLSSKRTVNRPVWYHTPPASNIIAQIHNTAHFIHIRTSNGSAGLGDVRVYLNNVLLLSFFDNHGVNDLGFTSGGAPSYPLPYHSITTFAESLVRKTGNIIRLEVDNQAGGGPYHIWADVYGYPKVAGAVVVDAMNILMPIEYRDAVPAILYTTEWSFNR